MKDGYFKQDLKQYLKSFKVPFVILMIILVIFIFKAVIAPQVHESKLYESPNTERVYGDRRVFDNADALTDSEEQALEAHIHEAEYETGLDIVIVTLDECLRDFEPEYRNNYTIPITPDKYVMVYADKFWEDNRFGYNAPQKLDGRTDTGDGVLLVDNFHRDEETGKIYTWMCTTGKAQEEYSSSMIDRALDAFYEDVRTDYYAACIKFVDHIVKDIAPSSRMNSTSSHRWPILLSLLVAFIFYMSNIKPGAAADTVSAETYLEGTPEFPVREDIFINKTVTKQYVAPQSSGGGGGGHSSGGGGSHGGGGHSR